MVSNHVFDVLSKHDPADLPPALTEYVSRMKREAYDYSEHSRVGAKHGEQITDETCERFCILGPPEPHVEKLRRLEAAGVDQWNIYLMTSGQEETLEAYGRDVIPALAAKRKALQADKPISARVCLVVAVSAPWGGLTAPGRRQPCRARRLRRCTRCSAAASASTTSSTAGWYNALILLALAARCVRAVTARSRAGRLDRVQRRPRRRGPSRELIFDFGYGADAAVPVRRRRLLPRLLPGLLRRADAARPRPSSRVRPRRSGSTA